MARRLVISAATLTALVTMIACGGGDGADPSAKTSDAGSTPTQTPTSDEDPEDGSGSSDTSQDQNGGGSGGGGGGKGDKGFKYVPWGPNDPPIPEQYAVLAATGGKPPNCDGLADVKPEGAFWQAALAVCRAIVEGATWPATTTVPEPPPDANKYEVCLNAELTEMLKRALRWQADNPGRQPAVEYPAESTISPCQARIYEVRVLGEAELDASESRLPDGVPLAITGSAMDRDPLTVTVDGQLAEFTGDFLVPAPDGDGLATVVVLAPPADQPHTAEIVVSTFRGRIATTVKLPGSAPTVTPPTDTAPPSSTDDETPPSPPPTESQPTKAADD